MPDPCANQPRYHRTYTAATILAEFMGPLFIVLFGGLAVVHGLPPVVIGICFAGALYLALNMWGTASAHYNPGFTIAKLMQWTPKQQNVFGPVTALIFIVVQIFGAVIGGGLLKYFVFGITGLPNYVDMGACMPGENFSVGRILLMEYLLSFFVTAVWLNQIDRFENAVTPRLTNALILGFAVTVGAHVSGGCINPARVLGPLFWVMPGSKAVSVLVIYYLVFTVLGSVTAGLLYRFVLTPAIYYHHVVTDHLNKQHKQMCHQLAVKASQMANGVALPNIDNMA